MFYLVDLNPVQRLRCQLVPKFPLAQLDLFPSTEEENKSFQNPDNHPWFLNIYKEEKEIAIEWTQEKGFNIRMFVNDKNHEKPVISCLAPEIAFAFSIIEDFLIHTHSTQN